MIMIRAARIKSSAAIRADGLARKIFRNCQLISAIAAQNRGRFEFRSSPNFWLVFGVFSVAFVTRKPFAAAFEFDGDNVFFAFVMSASGLRVNF
jgi:hypothetical protein